MGQALASRTYADLAALTADLPAGLAEAEPPCQPAESAHHCPVRTAAWLMCLGAVLTLADVATVLVTLGAVKSAAVQDVDFAGGQWHIFMLTLIVSALASTPIVAGVWLWLAWANRRGYHWARFASWRSSASSRLGGSSSCGRGEDALPYTWADVLATTVLWLVGLVAMALIFTQRASPYYQRRAATRAATPANGTGR